jgi:arylformamidase
MTHILFDAGGSTWRADLSRVHDISIPMRFDGAQPNAYDVAPATAHAYETGGFVGDVRRGGSCNFDVVSLIPHCNGTHTECVGHLTRERIAVTDTFAGALMPATLVTVEPVPALATSESYMLVKEEEDRVITAAALEDALVGVRNGFTDALVIRTLPNDEGKSRRRYAEHAAPFFTIEAMHAIVARGVRHLLVDIPSLDRAYDEGLLSAHRVYWNIVSGSHDLEPGALDDAASPALRTITEMVYVPDHVDDGAWLLSLQSAPFVLDAAPSRPLLYHITPHIPS